MTAISKRYINNATNEADDQVSLHRRLRRMKRRLLFNCVENAKKEETHRDRHEMGATPTLIKGKNETSLSDVSSFESIPTTISAYQIENMLNDSSNRSSTLARE